MEITCKNLKYLKFDINFKYYRIKKNMKTRSGKIYNIKKDDLPVSKNNVIKNRNFNVRDILGFIIDILMITVILNILFLTLHLTKLSVKGKY